MELNFGKKKDLPAFPEPSQSPQPKTSAAPDPYQRTPKTVVPERPKTHKGVQIGVIAFVILAVGAIAYVLYLNKGTSTTDQASTEITVKKVDTQYGYLKFANGHYMSDIAAEDNAANMTLYYDDSNVFAADGSQGVVLKDYALSRNGEHYIFTIDTFDPNQTNAANFDNVFDIYVDGNKVSSTTGQIRTPAVSDDGQHYFYAKSDATSNDDSSAPWEVVKDGVSIYQSTVPISDLQISTDGTKFLAVADSAGINDDDKSFISLNGAEFFQSNSGELQASLSPNGNSYIVLQAGKLFVDGGAQLADVTFDMGSTPLYISDSEHYSVYSQNSDTVYVDGNPHEVTQNVDDGGAGIAAYINEDASHVLIFDKDGWKLDDNSVDIDPATDPNQVELIGNTINVYNIAE